jgi:tetratricopeptide (TPR) repeat protein
MTSQCRYHPTRPAHFQCSKCNTSYCPECISKRIQGTLAVGGQQTVYFCPKCNLPAETLSVGSLITPFWDRLSQFFLYPLQLEPILFIAILSVLNTFLYWLFFAHLFLWGLLIKYSYAVLVRTAQGDLRPPTADSRTISEDLGDVLKQIVLFVLIGLLFSIVTAKLGSVAGVLFLILALLFVPSMIILLAITNSLINAMNPMAFVRLAWRIGNGYLLMYLFLALLFIAPSALAHYLFPLLPGFLERFIASAAVQYYTIVSYNLMGYVILQHHEEIGFHGVDYEDLKEQAPVLEDLVGKKLDMEKGPEDIEGPLIGRLDLLIKEGRIEDAFLLMRNEAHGDIKDRRLSQRYYQLLKLNKRKGEMLDHAVSYLDALVGEEDQDEACKVYRECISYDPHFTPKPDALLKIGGWLMQSGAGKEAYRAYTKFIKGNPEDPSLFKAYFLTARVLHEKLNDTGKAQQILKGIIKRHPNDDIVLYARKYLDKMG